MKSSLTASRRKGISTPSNEASPQPTELEAGAARRVVALLEDRLVLYDTGPIEVPSHFVQSVMEIMHGLSDELAMLGRGSRLAVSLRAMRSSCRKFLDCVVTDGHEAVQHTGEQDRFADPAFSSALDELRGAFGIHVAKIAAQFKLDIRERLASILPANANAGK